MQSTQLAQPADTLQQIDVPRPGTDAPREAQRIATVYRKDIDGLRAVAVLPVVAYHVGLHALRGGFIGVDVFFVISGFLITQLLYKDIRANRFSIITFYERRIRRIFPALIAVLLAVYVLAILYCLPSELVDVSKSVTAAALSVSNFYFWLHSGYFDGDAISKPLLHTWSLAVEEQFYLFWPLLLFTLHRFVRSRLVPVTLGLSCVSFALSIAGMWYFPSANFYLPFTRAWELGIGALLALDAVPVLIGPAMRNVLAALGLALIIASVFLINPDLPFPGLLAAVPCVGAALVILAGRDGDSLVARALSWRPVVFIGLISYSLYLWHWPITVFQKTYGAFVGGLSDATVKLLIIAVSLLIATLSWKFIEQPFRTGPWRPSKRRLLQIAATATSLVLALSVSAWAAGGFPARYSARELQVASYLDYPLVHNFGRVGQCYLLADDAQTFAPECLALAKGKKNFLLLGDSHAAELWYGLSRVFPDVNFLEAASSDCFPTIVHSLSEAGDCTHLMDYVLKTVLTQEHVDRVLLVARWKSGLLDNVAATLAWLKARHIPVTVLGPTGRYDTPFPRLLISAMRESDPQLVQEHVDSTVKSVDAELSRLVAAQGVPYVSLFHLQCDLADCALRSKGMPMIFDDEHYTGEGSIIMAERMRAAGIHW